MKKDLWQKSSYWWEVLQRRYWTKALFSLVIIIGFLMWPVSYPIIVQEIYPEVSHTIPLSSANPIKIIVPAPERPIIEVVLITGQRVRVPSDTALLFEAHLIESSQRLASYTLRTTFGEVFDPANGTIAFPVKKIPANISAELAITLSAPHLNQAQALPLRPQQAAPKTAAIIVRASRPVATTIWHYITDLDVIGEDIYYSWLAGQDVLNGDNPYVHIAEKPATYLPLFYQVSAISQQAGLRDYGPWLAFWKGVFTLATVGIAAAVWIVMQRRGQILLATAGVLFILFNRWTLYVLRVGQTDLLALLLLVLAVVLLVRRPKLALVLLGISLAIKQVAIFCIPLFLIATWHAATGTTKQRLKKVAMAALVIAAVPFLSSLPFIIDNAAALATGLAISTTRGVSDFGAAPLGWILTLSGRANTYLTFGLMLLIYASALKTRVSIVTGSLLIFTIYIGFYSVNFHQYFVWLVPFIPLAASESASKLHNSVLADTIAYAHRLPMAQGRD